jgi:hypothetical protein
MFPDTLNEQVTFIFQKFKDRQTLEPLEEEGDMFLQNIKTNLPSVAVSHQKRPESSITPPQTPQNLQSSMLLYCL